VGDNDKDSTYAVLVERIATGSGGIDAAVFVDAVTAQPRGASQHHDHERATTRTRAGTPAVPQAHRNGIQAHQEVHTYQEAVGPGDGLAAPRGNGEGELVPASDVGAGARVRGVREED
jgi:hypothetical protein